MREQSWCRHAPVSGEKQGASISTSIVDGVERLHRLQVACALQARPSLRGCPRSDRSLVRLASHAPSTIKQVLCLSEGPIRLLSRIDGSAYLRSWAFLIAFHEKAKRQRLVFVTVNDIARCKMLAAEQQDFILRCKTCFHNPECGMQVIENSGN